VHQIGYLQSLYQDAWSTEHKRLQLISALMYITLHLYRIWIIMTLLTVHCLQT